MDDSSSIIVPKKPGHTVSHPCESHIDTIQFQHHSTPISAPLALPSNDEPVSQYRVSLDNQSGFQSHFTDSTGRQSQLGATWKDALVLTMNSGFAFGTPRSDNYKGVREGRESRLPPWLKGVGRTGKEPAPVPEAMLRALGVKADEGQVTTGEIGGTDSATLDAATEDAPQSQHINDELGRIAKHKGNSAIEAFHQLADDFSLLSRQATWGTTRHKRQARITVLIKFLVAFVYKLH